MKHWWCLFLLFHPFRFHSVIITADNVLRPDVLQHVSKVTSQFRWNNFQTKVVRYVTGFDLSTIQFKINTHEKILNNEDLQTNLSQFMSITLVIYSYFAEVMNVLHLTLILWASLEKGEINYLSVTDEWIQNRIAFRTFWCAAMTDLFLFIVTVGDCRWL